MEMTVENIAMVKSLKSLEDTIGNIYWVGNTVHDDLDKCLRALNSESNNSGWYNPTPERIPGLTGVYMINQNGSLFYEARIIKIGEKEYIIEWLSDSGFNEFEKLYSKFINEKSWQN